MPIYYPDVDGALDCSKLSNNFREVLKRANHTGSQAASTIYDLYSVVSNYDFITNLEEGLVTLNSDLTILRNDLFGSGQLSQLITNLQQQISNLIADLDSSISSTSTIIDIQATLASHEVDINNLLDLASDLQDGTESLLTRLDTAEGTLDSHTTSISNLTTLTGTHTTSIGTLTTTTSALQTAVTTIQVSLTALSTLVGSNNTTLTGNLSNLTSRVIALETGTSGLTSLTNRVAALEVSSGATNKVPPGAIMPVHTTFDYIPAGWVPADGRTVTRTDGWTGVIPDYRDRFIKGASSSTIGATGGSNSLTITTSGNGGHAHSGSSIGGTHLTIDQIPSHSHIVEERKWANNTSGGTGGWVGGESYQSQHAVTSQATGGGNWHNHPLYIQEVGHHDHTLSFDNQPAFLASVICYKL